ncbi:MAG: aromatic-ring-hydroxylating dioxygenase subunit beta [Methyloligellaceae bacterium]
MTSNGANVAETVRDAIYRSCLLLDDQKWGEWLEQCEDDFQYAIKAYSPEISYDMTYYSGSRDDLATMTGMLPKHNSEHSPFKRHATVYSVELDEDGTTATAVSSLVVYQNMLDGVNAHLDSGESQLFLIGKYLDTLKIENGEAKFVAREVRLDTRRLDRGSHWPI